MPERVPLNILKRFKNVSENFEKALFHSYYDTESLLMAKTSCSKLTFSQVSVKGSLFYLVTRTLLGLRPWTCPQPQSCPPVAFNGPCTNLFLPA